MKNILDFPTSKLELTHIKKQELISLRRLFKPQQKPEENINPEQTIYTSSIVINPYFANRDNMCRDAVRSLFRFVYFNITHVYLYTDSHINQIFKKIPPCSKYLVLTMQSYLLKMELQEEFLELHSCVAISIWQTFLKTQISRLFSTRQTFL